MNNDKAELVGKLTNFLRQAGIEVKFDTLDPDTPLPGLTITDGALTVDPELLLYPGDLLHEAGHLAPFPLSVRKAMNGRLDNSDQNLAGEVMAFAWSYAACLHLDIDPRIVFHGGGYQGGGDHIAETFLQGRTVPGVPLMEWYGLTYTNERAQQLGEKPFPHLIKWVNDQE
jgi:hypothetical protein